MPAMTDREIQELFQPLYVRFASIEHITTNAPLLAHYTSIKVIEQILQRNEIWFSNPLFMNDLQELRFGMIEGTKLFSNAQLLKKAGGTDNRAAILQHAFSHFSQNFENLEAFDTYVFCLRADPGSS